MGRHDSYGVAFRPAEYIRRIGCPLVCSVVLAGGGWSAYVLRTGDEDSLLANSATRLTFYGPK